MALSVALTADPELPVPPVFYGGIERIVDMLANGLSERGYEVTLFAHRDSCTSGRLIAWPGVDSSSTTDTILNASALAKHTLLRGFDIVHSFSRIAYLTPILPLAVPKLMTYQRSISQRTVGIGHALSRDTLEFTAISSWMMQHVKHVGRWNLVPNGVPLHIYPFQATTPIGAPFVFLGRVEEIKGPHLAIQIAKLTGQRLVIAGNIPDDKRGWYNVNIKPHIDGQQISYIGPVTDEEKSKLLGNARALLMPVLWDEPFGIVMIEALASGTPVLGLSRGAVPEIVKDGITGFVRDDIAGLVKAAHILDRIERLNCRRDVEKRYCAEVIVDRYIEVYSRHSAAKFLRSNGLR